MAFSPEQAWWNQPAAQPAAAAPSAQPESQAPPAPPQPLNEQAVREIAQRTLLENAKTYENWSTDRRTKQEAATAKFLADPSLAPYYPVAVQFYTQLNLQSGQQMPVEQLFDMTTAHVQGLRNMGVKPPPPTKPSGGFAPGGQGWDVGNSSPDGNPRQGVIRTEDPEEVLARKNKYLQERRMDFELRRDRSTPSDDIVKSVMERASSSMLKLQAG